MSSESSESLLALALSVDTAAITPCPPCDGIEAVKLADALAQAGKVTHFTAALEGGDAEGAKSIADRALEAWEAAGQAGWWEAAGVEVEVGVGSVALKVHNLTPALSTDVVAALYSDFGSALSPCVAFLSGKGLSTAKAPPVTTVIRTPKALPHGFASVPPPPVFMALSSSTTAAAVVGCRRSVQADAGVELVQSVLVATRLSAVELGQEPPLLHILFQSSAPLVLDSVVTSDDPDDVNTWALTAGKELAPLLQRAGFQPGEEDNTWSPPRVGCAIVVLSWGPGSEWAASHAANHARRLLAAKSCTPAVLHGTTLWGGPKEAGADDTDVVARGKEDAVKKCLLDVGLVVHDNEVTRAAELIGVAHMPWTAAGMVELRFIQPLAYAVSHVPVDKRTSFLRGRAPFSGVAEFIANLPSFAVDHAGISHWVLYFLMIRCGGECPAELDGLSVGGGSKEVAAGKPVSAMGSGGIDGEAFRTTAGPDLMGLVNDTLGDVGGRVVLFHGTTLRYLKSVMTDPRRGSGLLKRDFGPALYTTTIPEQALAWAWLHRADGNPAAVVAWYVPTVSYAALASHTYAFGAEWKEVVWNWRVLEDGDRADFSDYWEGNGKDVVCGPVARLRPGTPSWADADFDDIHSLNCSPYGTPARYGNQQAFQSTALFRAAGVSVCGVVVLEGGEVLTVSSPAGGAAGGAAARGRGRGRGHGCGRGRGLGLK